jgi:magnesium chelatase subunit D
LNVASATDVAFPFCAIVGQEPLLEALLACAVDPAIGGVLVRGERGTAKSTAVRALAPLLPPVNGRTPVPLVELPVGATADRLLGSLDVERALTGGEAVYEPGLLAAADRGVLYVDEVNLLPDHLVDVLLDAAAMGRVHVERDGMSASHDARFLLVGTMNPEEGELRPQLLDRFGLSVEVAGSADPAVRVEIIRRRLAFDADPSALRARFAAQEQATAARIAAAQSLLPRISLDDRTLLLIAHTCAALNVDGMRADITTARTAKALAALDQRTEVTPEHVKRAALLALAHRRRRGPLDPPGLTEQELSDAMGNDEPEPEPDPTPSGNGSGPSPDASADRPERGGESPPGDIPHQEAGSTNGSQPSEAGEQRPDEAPRPSSPTRSPAGELTDSPAATTQAPPLTLAGTGTGSAGRRSRAATRDGHPIDSKPHEPGTVTDLSVIATLRAAATRGSKAIEHRDLREHIRTGKEANLLVFLVDASGSMGARRRMSQVKGTILGLLEDAYRRRDRIALITFRGADAQLILPPTSSVEQAARLMTDLPTGGGTPLAGGLDRARALIAAERVKDATRRSMALVITDGRASNGAPGRQAAREAAQRLATTADGVVVFDAEEGRIRLGLAGEIAAAAGARLLPMTALPTTPKRAAA